MDKLSWQPGARIFPETKAYIYAIGAVYMFTIHTTDEGLYELCWGKDDARENCRHYKPGQLAAAREFAEDIEAEAVEAVDA